MNGSWSMEQQVMPGQDRTGMEEREGKIPGLAWPGADVR
jgi:hypothetical protein